MAGAKAGSLAVSHRAAAAGLTSPLEEMASADLLSVCTASVVLSISGWLVAGRRVLLWALAAQRLCFNPMAKFRDMVASYFQRLLVLLVGGRWFIGWGGNFKFALHFGAYGWWAHRL